MRVASGAWSTQGPVAAIKSVVLVIVAGASTGRKPVRARAGLTGLCRRGQVSEVQRVRSAPPFRRAPDPERHKARSELAEIAKVRLGYHVRGFWRKPGAAFDVTLRIPLSA